MTFKKPIHIDSTVSCQFVLLQIGLVELDAVDTVCVSLFMSIFLILSIALLATILGVEALSFFFRLLSHEIRPTLILSSYCGVSFVGCAHSTIVGIRLAILD